MKVQNLGCRFAVDLIYYAALNLQKAVVIEEVSPSPQLQQEMTRYFC